jgi:hypothetical protein
MQPIRTLTDVLDDGAFISVERQRRLAEVIGEDGPYGDHWDADLSAGVLTFTGRGGTLTTPAHVIGTAAPGPGSWLWGWHNVNGFPDAVVARSAQVRELGTRFGITQLTAEEVPLRGEPRQDATEYAVVAGLVNGGLPHYTVEVGAGTIVAFLIEEPSAALPAPSTATAVTVIGEALTGGAVHDHRRALAAYAELRGLGLVQAGRDLVLSGPDGSVTVVLDDEGRITAMRGTLGAAGAR